MEVVDLWVLKYWFMVRITNENVVNYNILDYKFHKCSKMRTNLGSCRSCTASEASPFKFGTNQVHIGLMVVQNGHIKRLTDQDIQSSVLEIMGTNVTTSFVTCPANKAETLGIKLPFLVMIIKNVHMFVMKLKKYFTFEVEVLDDKNVRRRFRASNYQSTTRVKPFICTMPMRLDEGINYH